MLGPGQPVSDSLRLPGSVALLVSAAVWFLVWGQVIHIALQSGILWPILSEDLAKIPERRVEATLFSYAGVPRKQIVAIGDSTFQEQLSRRLPADAPVTPITHEWMDLESLAVLLSKIPPDPDQIVLLQNEPAYWSDIRTDFWADRDIIRPRHRTPLWNYRSGAEGEGVIPSYRREAGIVIRTLGLWAREGGRRSEPNPGAHRLTSYFQAGFIPPEEKIRFLLEAPTWGAIVQYSEPVFVDSDLSRLQLNPYVAPFPEGITQRLYWVTDLAGLPDDTPADLVEDFSQYFRAGTFDARLGHFVDFESLPSIVASRIENR